MFCSTCGSQLIDGDQFCRNCGAPVSQAAQPSGAFAAQPSGAFAQQASGAFAQQPSGAYRMPGGSTPASKMTVLEMAPARPTGPVDDISTDLTITVVEGNRTIMEIQPFQLVSQTGKLSFTFGSADDNDIVIPSTSGIVSRHHGSLLVDHGACFMLDNDSTNGLYSGGAYRKRILLGTGVVVSIGTSGNDYECIMFLCGHAGAKWKTVGLAGRDHVSIGRMDNNDVVLSSPAVSRQHATMFRTQGGWAIQDNNSSNGVFVDGQHVMGTAMLRAGACVRISSHTVIFLGDAVMYSAEAQGVEVTAYQLVQRRKSGKGTRVTTDHVSLHIRRGQFVAIVGGSGSGKSTLLNELNGSDPAVEGGVLIDGIDLYPNYDLLKNTIGYVPQDDIVYSDLTLIDMLLYAAELRMPPDTSPAERKARAEEVIKILELEGERNNRIGSMSGGQRKRASIAVELLADPRLLFLDEPTSGLDPGIERTLMEKLSAMAKDGRTIILVTHTTLNLHLCDQVVFLGPGGKLCYAGPPKQALSFFEVDDFVKIYREVAADPTGWRDRFERSGIQDMPEAPAYGAAEPAEAPRPSFASQVGTLSRRYAHLLINDRSRLILLLAQAPLLAWLISLVAGDGCFEQFEATQSCLFALSCAAFWVGILDSIQEICKERTILKREYAGGVRLGAYLVSKVLVLGVMCLVQSLLLCGVFVAMKGAPEGALLGSSVLELFITTLLTTFSAMCMGLAVSAIFANPDQAIALAPILIMPQILFSGLVFKLEGAMKVVSAFVNCRWAMEGYGTTADLNSLDLRVYGTELEMDLDQPVVDMLNAEEEVYPFHIDKDTFPHDADDAYTYTLAHLGCTWGILVLFCAVCLGICAVVLRRNIRR